MHVCCCSRPSLLSVAGQKLSLRRWVACLRDVMPRFKCRCARCLRRNSFDRSPSPDTSFVVPLSTARISKDVILSPTVWLTAWDHSASSRDARQSVWTFRPILLNTTLHHLCLVSVYPGVLDDQDGRSSPRRGHSKALFFPCSASSLGTVQPRFIRYVPRFPAMHGCCLLHHHPWCSFLDFFSNFHNSEFAVAPEADSLVKQTAQETHDFGLSRTHVATCSPQVH